MVPDDVYAAARDGIVPTLKTYFESGDRDPNEIHEPTGSTLLDAAARGSAEDVISTDALAFIIKQGATINYREPDDGPLHNPLALAAAAIKNRDCMFEAVKLLVQNGADVNAEAGVGIVPGFTPFFQAVIDNDRRMFKYLLDRGADLDSGLEARQSAASDPDIRVPHNSMRRMGNQTIEKWVNTIIISQPGYDSQICKYRRKPMLKVIADVRAAGGTLRQYLWAPRTDLCMLRILSEQGRATPHHGLIPSKSACRWSQHVVDDDEHMLLERLFAWSPPYTTDSRRRTRSSQAAVRAYSHDPLPRDVFMIVLSYWESERERMWGYLDKYDFAWQRLPYL